MLRIENVSKSFGALTAVDNVYLELGSTGISGLVGPNGSGKTTLFHLITGFYTLDKGRIYFKDRKISGLAPYLISRRGMARTFQQTRILPALSVLDNLVAAVPQQTGEKVFPLFFRAARIRHEEKQNHERACHILDLIQMTDSAHEPAGNLSFGQQKLVELGRVLMADPKMILLDEPTAGINPSLTRRLVEIILDLREHGIQFFLIEHNMPLVAEICENIFVMDSGVLIFSGPPREAQRDKRVIEAYLGRNTHVA